MMENVLFCVFNVMRTWLVDEVGYQRHKNSQARTPRLHKRGAPVYQYITITYVGSISEIRESPPRQRIGQPTSVPGQGC